MQSKSRGFGDVVSQMKFLFVIWNLKLRNSQMHYKKKFVELCGCGMGSIIVNNMNESPEELWNDVEETTDEEPKERTS